MTMNGQNPLGGPAGPIMLATETWNRAQFLSTGKG